MNERKQGATNGAAQAPGTTKRATTEGSRETGKRPTAGTATRAGAGTSAGDIGAARRIREAAARSHDNRGQAGKPARNDKRNGNAEKRRGNAQPSDQPKRSSLNADRARPSSSVGTNPPASVLPSSPAAARPPAGARPSSSDGTKPPASTRPSSSVGTKPPASTRPSSSVGTKPPGSTRPSSAVAKPPVSTRPSSAVAAKPPAKASARQPRAAKASVASAEDIRIGDLIVVTIKRLGINGEGVGYFKRKAVFVPGALPDEVVRATVTRIEPSFLHATLRDIEKQSPYRMKPACPVYESCGGCQLQHMNYEGQLRAKEELVREAFDRYTGLTELTIRPIIGMKDPWGYRNKAQLQVGLEQGSVVTGLYAAGSHKLVDISGCKVQHPDVNRAIETVRYIIEELRIPIYNERRKSGSLRTVVARIALASNALQLTFITASDELPQAGKLVAAIRKRLPNVAAIAHNINSSDTPLVFGDVTRLLWGQERLDETLGDVKLSLSPRAFFQLNPAQTIPLYDAAREAAALTGRELVIDAYCGTGAIALWLAPHAREVRGIEAIPEAVRDAKRNAERTGAANVIFYEGKVEQLLPQWLRTGISPDVIVVDPPRTGCDRRLLDSIAAAKPHRLVYVSCNPSTLAKDCRVLLDAGFRIEWVQPVDMFPQTAHVESVVLMVPK